MISLENHMAKSVLQERMLATLAVFFGGLALLLGAIGSYGVMAFQVARRRREIGIRMALGAEPRGVVAMILNQAARLTLLGCAIGVAGGLALARVTQGILYEVRANDPATFGAAMTVVVLVALAAAYLPARSAARINPVETLKVE
jgi:ABC-type antimicrobial peptide transport system permease subunit